MDMKNYERVHHRKVCSYAILTALIVALFFSVVPVRATSSYDIATQYIGRNIEELIQVIGQPIKYEITPDCQGLGNNDALYQYADFSVYARGNNEYVIVSVNKNKAVTSTASKTDTAVSGKDQVKGKWQKKKGYVYYANSRGLTKINGRTYMFDRYGRQQTGWVKIKKNYYFFKIANGAGGFLMTSCTVNGMKCDKNGKAKGAASKLKVLAMASSYVHQHSSPLLSRYNRYRKCYQRVITTFRYGGSHTFKGGDWSTYYAYQMLKKHKQVCWGFAGALGYMANACGYTNVRIQATRKHGWANVNGKIVDGSYGRSHQSFKWFMFKAGAKGRIFPASIYKHPDFSVKI